MNQTRRVSAVMVESFHLCGLFPLRVHSVSVLAYPSAMSWALIICTKYEINSEKV